MINNVVLTGRLTKAVDLRYTPNGTAVGTFNLAVDRQFKNAQGERETDFVNCVIWRKAAESFVEYTRKGSLIGIQGRIQTRSYENQQGQRVYVTEIIVENFTLLESKATTEQRDASSKPKPNRAENDFNQKRQDRVPDYHSQDDPFYGNSNMSVSDDDLPF